MSGLWTIIPVKDTLFSKQRLGERLTDKERQILAQTMLEDVLDAVIPTQDISPIVLVTVDPAAGRLAAQLGLRTLADGASDGHTGAVTAAAQRLSFEGARGFVTIPGDLPSATTADVRSLLQCHNAVSDPAFTIVPSHDRKGSNAIACSPASAVPLRFGDDSFYPHLAAARERGIEPTILELPSIAEDIDTPQDIDRFMALPGTQSTRTYAYLKEIGCTSPATVKGSA